MSRFSLTHFSMAVAACWHAAFCSTAAALPGNAPLEPGEIVITEFFEDLFRINRVTGDKTPIIPGAFNPSEFIAIDRNREIIALESSTDQLVRFDPVSLTVLPLTAATFSSAVDIAVEPSGSILVADFDNIYRVHPFNGITTTLLAGATLNGGFFSMSNMTVAPSGRIFVTEFFNDVWEVDPVSGAATPLALSRNLSIPSLINARSDDDLILQEFNTGDLLRIDPDTGSVVTFASGLPTFVSDIDIEYDDDVLVAWSDGVNRYDANTGAATTLTFETPFFSPGGIAVVPIPEPSAVALGLILSAFCCMARQNHPN